VADTYDAMASDRAYRKRLSDEVVLGTIQQGAAAQFDREVVEAFMALCEKGELGCKHDAACSNTTHNESRLDLKVPHGL
jgi:HD-GYP domain-containing protein (c-di-GMP phosphodiesterase class II)